MTENWHFYPPIAEQPCLVMSLAEDAGSIWAGGYGGVAHYDGQSWQARVAGLHLASIASIAKVGNWLFAGGAGGIARSGDAGASWQAVTMQGDVGAVTAIAASPNFEHDSTLLAATLNNGVSRTTDGGQLWTSANFGLASFELTALIWLYDDVVLAAAVDGIYRSPNAGRAWRLCTGTEGAPIAALAVLPNGSVLGAVEFGGLLRSDDDGVTWAHFGNLPPDVQITTIVVVKDRIVIGTFANGILCSTDGGTSWISSADGTVLSMIAVGDTLYAGTDQGVLVSSDSGENWHLMPAPPLHDLKRLLVANDEIFVYGTHSTPMIYQNGWAVMDAVPLPLTALVSSPDGALLASSQAGLVRSRDSGQTWLTVVPNVSGCVHFMAFRDDGTGIAGSADGLRLLRTRDFGVTWEILGSPFGVLPLTALQIFEGGGGMLPMFMAVTYDPRRNIAQLWRSTDDGEKWERGAEIKVRWPLVSTLEQPPLFTVGGQALLWQPDSRWDARKVGDGSGIRRMIGNEHVLFALTTTGIFRSLDAAQNWESVGEDLQQAVDIALDKNDLYVLLAGGQVCHCFLYNED
jgi:photosystem II stability/assembly factor-like uncharacterized protein